MLERLRQNSDNLIELYMMLKDPAVKNARANDPAFEEIKRKTLSLSNMANHLYDSGEAPTQEELRKFEESRKELDKLSEDYLKEREANADAEIQKRCDAVQKCRTELQKVGSTAEWIEEHLDEYPQGPSKEEQTAQKLQELKDLEKNPKELVNRLTSIRENDLDGNHFPGKEAEDEAITRYFQYLTQTGPDKQIAPEHVKVLDDIAQEMAQQRYDLSMTIGHEMEEREEQIKRGEIPGTELISKEPDAAKDIANEMVIRLSPNVGKRMALDNLQSTITNVIEGKMVGEQASEEYFINSVGEAGNKIIETTDHPDLYERAQETECKAGKYGYEINLNHREMGDPYFTKVPEDIAKIQEMQEDQQIREYQAAQGKSMEPLIKYASDVNEIATQAKKKLEELNALKIDGHEDSTFFTNMKKALDKVSKLNEGAKPTEVNKALEDLQKASDTYYNERKGLFRSWSDVGRKRRIFAEQMRDITAGNIERMKEARPGVPQNASIKSLLNTISRSIERAETELKRRQEARTRQQEEQRARDFRKLRDGASLAAKKSLEEFANKKESFTPEEKFSVQKQLACLVLNEKLGSLEAAKQMQGIPQGKEAYNKMILDLAGSKVFQDALPADLTPNTLKGLMQDPKTVKEVLGKCEKSLTEMEKANKKENKKESKKENLKGKENEPEKGLYK